MEKKPQAPRRQLWHDDMVAKDRQAKIDRYMWMTFGTTNPFTEERHHETEKSDDFWYARRKINKSIYALRQQIYELQQVLIELTATNLRTATNSN